MAGFCMGRANIPASSAVCIFKEVAMLSMWWLALRWEWGWELLSGRRRRLGSDNMSNVFFLEMAGWQLSEDQAMHKDYIYFWPMWGHWITQDEGVLMGKDRRVYSKKWGMMIYWQMKECVDTAQNCVIDIQLIKSRCKTRKYPPKLRPGVPQSLTGLNLRFGLLAD